MLSPVIFPPGLSETGDDTVCYGITNTHENNRDRAGRILGGQHTRCADGNDYVNLLLDKL